MKAILWEAEVIENEELEKKELNSCDILTCESRPKRDHTSFLFNCNLSSFLA